MKKNSLSGKILFAIGDCLDNLFDIDSGKMIFSRQRLKRKFPLYKNSEFYNGMCGLERYGYIGRKKIDGKKLYCLTEKGKSTIIKNILKNKNKRDQWDNKWRLVIFDIPEMSRKDRDFLRRELQLIGFTELQKSVWIFPHDFEKELSFLLKSWKVEFNGDIRFLTIEKMQDKDLRKHFNLN